MGDRFPVSAFRLPQTFRQFGDLELSGHSIRIGYFHWFGNLDLSTPSGSLVIWNGLYMRDGLVIFTALGI